jgi:hypothetical protein
MLALFGAALACACQQSSASPPLAPAADDDASGRARGEHPTVVVVELFSSEGCSSCPPADAFLAELERAQPVAGVRIVALEEHVDYWDDLGWRDPFSQATFSSRQREYARALADRSVYTPQLLVDGATVLDRSDAHGTARALRASAALPRATVTLVHDGDRVKVDIVGIPAPPAGEASEVWLAVTERGLSTRVPRGENAGRTLAHAPVVRSLRKLGDASGGEYHTVTTAIPDASWNRAALRVVVLVQRRGTRRIVGAATL